MQKRNILTGLFTQLCHCERSVAIAELSRNQEPSSRHPAPDAGSVNVGVKTGFFALRAQNDMPASVGQPGKAAAPPQNDAPSSRHPELVSGSQGRNDGMTCHCERPAGASQSHYRQVKAAFTLAEVLITLGVIGVVAAVTLPTVVNNMQARIRSEQVRTAKYKFTLATDKMNSLGLIGPYDSTEAFVKELQKHLKLAKVCPPGKLEGCWPTKEVKIDNDGTLLEISKVKTGKQFSMEKNDKSDYSSNNVGIVTADGVPMIISYNKKCEPLDPVKQYAWTTEGNKPVSNATAGCVAAVMDINGSKKPNKLSEDVVLFNARGLGTGCAFELNGKCFSPLISSYAPLSINECLERKDELKIKKCPERTDYWAGAAAACGGVDKMAHPNDLAKIASSIYGTFVNSYDNLYNGLTYNTAIASKFGFPDPGSGSFYIWGSEENTYSVYSRGFSSVGTWKGSGSFESRYNSGFFALCISD